MITTKIKKMGNSSAVIIPKEIMDKLNLEQGDELYVNTDKQSMNFSVCNPEFAKDMDLAEEIMREDREVLNKLAQ